MIEIIDWLNNHAWDSFLYDIIKFSIAYVLSRVLWDGLIKSWWYGGWSVVLINTSTGEERRKITPAWAEKILKDKHDLSLYIKSFVSPFFYLNMDISDQKAENQGLIKIDHENKQITIDQSKNPKNIPEEFYGWGLTLKNGDAELATRNITPVWAQKILKDDYDFSIYINSFTSPYVTLTIDIASQQAKDLGLVKIDKSTKQITIDQAKNPPRVTAQSNG